mgnify:CR=1 FL=1
MYRSLKGFYRCVRWLFDDPRIRGLGAGRQASCICIVRHGYPVLMKQRYDRGDLQALRVR